MSPDQLTISWSWAALVINAGMDAKPGNTAGGLIWMMAFENLVLEMRNVICIEIRGNLVANLLRLVLIGRPFI